MYESYSREIYQYLQTHLPLIETGLSEIKLAVMALTDKVFPFVALAVVLMIIDRFVKKGDLI